jgi:hypothetical protein
MPPGKPSIEWEDAKNILTPLIYSGEIPGSMIAKDVYNIPQHKELFQKVRWDRFRDNLRALRRRIEKEYSNADFDQQALDHDRALYPIDNSKLRWPGSAAESALKCDVDEGKQKTMTPAQLRDTNEAYKEWPLNRFRDHIYQEERKRIETPYWASVRAEKQKKKEDARRKRAEKK